jgi:hypothetical protein
MAVDRPLRLESAQTPDAAALEGQGATAQLSRPLGGSQAEDRGFEARSRVSQKGPAISVRIRPITAQQERARGTESEPPSRGATTPRRQITCFASRCGNRFSDDDLHRRRVDVPRRDHARQLRLRDRLVKLDCLQTAPIHGWRRCVCARGRGNSIGGWSSDQRNPEVVHPGGPDAAASLNPSATLRRLRQSGTTTARPSTRPSCRRA